MMRCWIGAELEVFAFIKGCIPCFNQEHSDKKFVKKLSN